jgi:hypothetical protein
MTKNPCDDSPYHDVLTFLPRNGISQDHMKLLFHKYDEDKDGFLILPELDELVREVHKEDVEHKVMIYHPCFLSPSLSPSSAHPSLLSLNLTPACAA